MISTLSLGAFSSPPVRTTSGPASTAAAGAASRLHPAKVPGVAVAAAAASGAAASGPGSAGGTGATPRGTLLDLIG